MEIVTKYSNGDTVYYLECEKISKQCSTCEGTGRIDVEKGTLSWNIKCPDCNGKKKISDILHYEVANASIKGVIVKRGNQTVTKYVLNNNMHKKESALFSTREEAIKVCEDANWYAT